MLDEPVGAEELPAGGPVVSLLVDHPCKGADSRDQARRPRRRPGRLCRGRGRHARGCLVARGNPSAPRPSRQTDSSDAGDLRAERFQPVNPAAGGHRPLGGTAGAASKRSFISHPTAFGRTADCTRLLGRNDCPVAVARAGRCTSRHRVVSSGLVRAALPHGHGIGFLERDRVAVTPHIGATCDQRIPYRSQDRRRIGSSPSRTERSAALTAPLQLLAQQGAHALDAELHAVSSRKAFIRASMWGAARSRSPDARSRHSADVGEGTAQGPWSERARAPWPAPRRRRACCRLVAARAHGEPPAPPHPPRAPAAASWRHLEVTGACKPACPSLGDPVQPVQQPRVGGQPPARTREYRPQRR